MGGPEELPGSAGAEGAVECFRTTMGSALVVFGSDAAPALPAAFSVGALKPLPVQHLVWGWLPQWQPLSCRWGLSLRGLCPGHSVLRGRRVRDRQQPYGPAAADRAQIHLVLSALLSLHLGLQTRLQELPQQQPCARLYPCPAALLSLCRDLCPWLHLLCLCTNIRVSCKTDSTVYCRPV